MTCWYVKKNDYVCSASDRLFIIRGVDRLLRREEGGGRWPHLMGLPPHTQERTTLLHSFQCVGAGLGRTGRPLLSAGGHLPLPHCHSLYFSVPHIPSYIVLTLTVLA